MLISSFNRLNPSLLYFDLQRLGLQSSVFIKMMSPSRPRISFRVSSARRSDFASFSDVPYTFLTNEDQEYEIAGVEDHEGLNRERGEYFQSRQRYLRSYPLYHPNPRSSIADKLKNSFKRFKVAAKVIVAPVARKIKKLTRRKDTAACCFPIVCPPRPSKCC